MKKSIIGYVEPKKIVEVVAAVDEKKLDDFFDSIKDYDFEEGYISSCQKVVTSKNDCDIKSEELKVAEISNNELDKTLQTSQDVIDALKLITNQPVINFKQLTNLLESNSRMNNPKTKSIFSKFLDLYFFEKKTIYEQHKLSSLKKAVMRFGDLNDIDNFNSIISSLFNNTKFLRKLGRDTLLKKNDKDIEYFCGIDKQLVK